MFVEMLPNYLLFTLALTYALWAHLKASPENILYKESIHMAIGCTAVIILTCVLVSQLITALVIW